MKKTKQNNLSPNQSNESEISLSTNEYLKSPGTRSDDIFELKFCRPVERQCYQESLITNPK